MTLAIARTGPATVAILLAGAGLLLAGCAGGPRAKERPAQGSVRELPVSEVSWGPLNPARGEASPRAADLWGDRSGAGATGFLVRFADGFSSPPHIHNVTYRGVVIEGRVHNDDPGAAPMWMPAGSYWTQPAGESHITASTGQSMAYIEIADGPYLVRPTDRAFDTGERPINVDRANLVWLDASAPGWIDLRADRPGAGVARVATLWETVGLGGARGALLELPAGFKGELSADDATLRAVVIEGRVVLDAPGVAPASALEPGSAIEAEGAWPVRLSTPAGAGSVLYVRTNHAN